MKGDVGMSRHEKEGEQEAAYTKTESHPIPTSLLIVPALNRSYLPIPTSLLC